MSKTLRALIAASFAAATVALPTAAIAAPDDPSQDPNKNWGNEVADANHQEAGYGYNQDGTERTRGDWASGNATEQDGFPYIEGNGYANEIHEYAQKGAGPGKGNGPKSDNF